MVDRNHENESEAEQINLNWLQVSGIQVNGTRDVTCITTQNRSWLMPWLRLGIAEPSSVGGLSAKNSSHKNSLWTQ